MKRKLIYIEWIDASSPPGPASWHTEEALECWLKDAAKCFDVGFVIKEDMDYLYIVGGGGDETEEEYKTYHREVKVPLGCITRKIDLTRHIK